MWQPSHFSQNSLRPSRVQPRCPGANLPGREATYFLREVSLPFDNVEKKWADRILVQGYRRVLTYSACASYVVELSLLAPKLQHKSALTFAVKSADWLFMLPSYIGSSFC